MLKIKITNQPHAEGYKGAFFRFTTNDGKQSIKGIWDNWYEASATDDNGNEYRIVWAIANNGAFESGDEDCCNWDEPNEIYSYTEGKPIEAEIVW